MTSPKNLAILLDMAEQERDHLQLERDQLQVDNAELRRAGLRLEAQRDHVQKLVAGLGDDNAELLAAARAVDSAWNAYDDGSMDELSTVLAKHQEPKT